MTKLRRILIALAAPATIVLGLNQLGGNPLSQGYDTGFSVEVVSNPDPTLAITNDAGNLNCWIQLRVPGNSQAFSAKLSTGAPLWVYPLRSEGSLQWIAIVAEGQKLEEQFKWPAGTTVFLKNEDKRLASLALSDWKIFLSDKGLDSKERASWRKTLFRLSLLALVLAIVGVALEAYAKFNERAAPFTAQRCIEELIKTTEGSNPTETKWMQKILTKVLVEGTTVASALDPIPLKGLPKMSLWFKTRDEFRTKLNRLIVDLNTDLTYLNP